MALFISNWFGHTFDYLEIFVIITAAFQILYAKVIYPKSFHHILRLRNTLILMWATGTAEVGTLNLTYSSLDLSFQALGYFVDFIRL